MIGDLAPPPQVGKVKEILEYCQILCKLYGAIRITNFLNGICILSPVSIRHVPLPLSLLQVSNISQICIEGLQSKPYSMHYLILGTDSSKNLQQMLTNLEDVFQAPSKKEARSPIPPDVTDIEAVAQHERDRVAALRSSSADQPKGATAADGQPEPGAKPAEIVKATDEQSQDESGIQNAGAQLSNGSASLAELASQATNGSANITGL